MKTGESAHVSVHSLTLDGEGVAALDAREVLCRGVFPGEQADVQVSAISRHHPRAHARLVHLATGHPARRRPPCPNHETRGGRCTGCALMALDEPGQRAVKQIMLRDRFGLAVDEVVAAPAQLGYRYSSKRVALVRRGVPFLGSYALGTHDPAAMPDCLVDHPLLVRAFAAVESGMRAAGIAVYDERKAEGDLRYVWAKTNGRAVIVTLVTAADETRVAALLPALSETAVGVLHSVQGSRGNALRGRAATLLWGEREVSLSLLGERVEVGALGFLQPNPVVAEAAYRHLVALDAPESARGLALDLYAGAGITTRTLRGVYREVVACEAHPESAAALGVPAEPVEVFLARWLTDSAARTPDLVIANPPRKGLGPDVCRQLAALAAPRLHIMSCGPEGLARDLAALSERYVVEAIAAFDTLPQTPHVELVAKLVRRP
jgi:tRNA/tmRNA/rRNA uracil-C5-methylase (TrmA/RlmC/RlmD family)